MPWAPLKPCVDCPRLVATTRCAEHELAYTQRRHEARGGSGWAQSEQRARIIERDGGCVLEGPHEGRLELAHIVAIEEGGSSDDSNLRILCHLHHARETAEHARRRAGSR